MFKYILKLYKRAFIAFLKIGGIGTVILLPTLMIYGVLFPWQPAKQELKNYDSYYYFLNGVSYKNNNSENYSLSTRRYLLIHKSKFHSKTLVVSKESDKPLAATLKDGGLVSLIVLYLGAIFLTWWFWIRKPHITSR